jgi:hypothetical protein
MIKFTKILTRPDASIPFFESMDELVIAYFYYKFIRTKKVISDVKTLSDDKLILTSVSCWTSVEDYLDLLTNEYCYANIVIPSREYNTKHNITLEVITEEI